MFKRILGYKGFVKSVVVLSLIYAMVLFVLQWAFLGFSEIFISDGLTPKFILVLLVGGVICGFMVSYGKFWAKLKNEDYKNR